MDDLPVVTHAMDQLSRASPDSYDKTIPEKLSYDRSNVVLKGQVDVEENEHSNTSRFEMSLSLPGSVPAIKTCRKRTIHAVLMEEACSLLALSDLPLKYSDLNKKALQTMRILE